MQRVGLILPAGFDANSLAALSVFAAANRVVGHRRYDPRVLSAEGGVVRNGSGVDVLTQGFWSEPPLDTLVVAAAPAPLAPCRTLTTFLQDAAVDAVRILGVDAGALALADAGLLEGRRVAISPRHAAALLTRSPHARVEVDLAWAQEGYLWTGAGAFAGVLLALKVVEQDLGEDRAVATARALTRARAGAERLAAPLAQAAARAERIRRTLTFMRSFGKPPRPVRTEAIA